MGGCAGILPLNAEGRCNRKVPTVYAHSGKSNAFAEYVIANNILFEDSFECSI